VSIVPKQDTLPNIPESRSVGLLGMLERVALNPELPVEKLEKLLEMQIRIREIEAREAYATALAMMQPRLPNIAERGIVTGRYKYALWEDVVSTVTPILSAHGFSLSFRTQSDKDHVTVTGVLMHAAGHSESTTLMLPLDTSGNKPAVQALGSSTSYGKRYTAGALLNLRTGEQDNDGAPPRNTLPKITEHQAAELVALVDEVGKTMPMLLKKLSLEKIEDLPAVDYESTVKMIERHRK